MWTDENRQRYNRDKLRYPSDLTDEEWSEVKGLIRPAKRGGRPRDIDVREVLNGILYVLRTGCQWRYVPRDLPPRARCMVISNGGTTTGRSEKSIMHSIKNAANKSIGSQVPRLASSIARA
jgi:hypothetical protein